MHYTDLGYKDYDEYLSGPEWAAIHDYFYQNCGPYRCRVCGKYRRLLLHKRSYKYLSMRSLRRRYWFDFLIIRKLKKLMCWLCIPHNGLIHFYDDGRRVPLVYDYLLRRENEIVKRERSWVKKLLQVRPSHVFEAIGRAYRLD